MRIYNTRVDKYGWPIDDYKYLCDRGINISGGKWELKLEMKIWNFIARVVNFLK